MLVSFGWPNPHGVIGNALAGYSGLTWQILVGILVLYGLVVFPAITGARLTRKTPASLLETRTETKNFWPEYGRSLVGDGGWRWATYLPFNQVFRGDFTELTLGVLRSAGMAWDGLTVHVVSDLHFIGTPSRAYFDAVVRRINDWPTPDVLGMAGDFVRFG